MLCTPCAGKNKDVELSELKSAYCTENGTKESVPDAEHLVLTKQYQTMRTNLLVWSPRAVLSSCVVPILLIGLRNTGDVHHHGSQTVRAKKRCDTVMGVCFNIRTRIYASLSDRIYSIVERVYITNLK